MENNIKPDIFGSIIKYGKIIGLIWLFGFFKFGVLGVVSVLFWKGISVGFTSSFIVASTGNIGVFFVAKLYLVQTALLIPMCFAVGITAIRFSLKPASNTCLTPKKYCVFGLIQLIGILTLSLFDALIA